jgi:hypothetical protein
VSQKARAFTTFLIPGRSSLLMIPGIPGLRVSKYRATEARYQEHTALGAFYDTPNAAQWDIKGEALG